MRPFSRAGTALKGKPQLETSDIVTCVFNPSRLVGRRLVRARRRSCTGSTSQTCASRLSSAPSPPVTTSWPISRTILASPMFLCAAPRALEQGKPDQHRPRARPARRPIFRRVRRRHPLPPRGLGQRRHRRPAYPSGRAAVEDRVDMGPSDDLIADAGSFASLFFEGHPVIAKGGRFWKSDGRRLRLRPQRLCLDVDAARARPDRRPVRAGRHGRPAIITWRWR